MKNELAKLFELAKIDYDIDDLNSLFDQIPSEIDNLESQLAEGEADVLSKSHTLEILQHEIRDKESSVKQQQEWIADREVKVKDIKTIKEYQAGLKEVTKAKKDLDDLSGNLNSLRSTLDLENKVYVEAKENLDQKKQNAAQEISEKKIQLSTLKDQIAEKMTLRQTREKEVSEALLKKYKFIKTRFSPALSLASQNGVCQECNMNIPPQLFIELQKFEKMLQCPRCQRILYFKATESTS